MFNAKYKKGMADAAKAYKGFGEKQEAALNHILEEVRQGKKTLEAAIAELNGNLDGLYDHLLSKEKASLYTVYTPFDIKELGDQERLFLLGALLSLTVDKSPNENQQNYIRAVQKYLEVKEPPFGVDPMAIENIEDIPSQKAILQTVLEYLRLQDGDGYDETKLQQEFLDAFCLSNKVKNEIIQHVELLYSATGAQGLAEKYGYVPEEDIIECQSSDVPDSNYPITMGENLCDEIFDFLVRKKLSGRFQETDRYFIYTTWYDDQADVYSVNKQNGEKKCCLTQKEIQQVTGSVGYFSLECKPIIDDTVLINEYSNNYKNQDIYALDIAQRKIEHLFTCSGDDDLYVPSCRYMIMANRITRDIKLYDCNTRKMRLVRTPDSQDGTQDAALLSQGYAQTESDDLDGALEEGVTHTGQGAHEGGFHGVDGIGIEGVPIGGVLLLHGGGQTQGEGAGLRGAVVEGHMPVVGFLLIGHLLGIIVVGVDAVQGGDNPVQKAHIHLTFVVPGCLDRPGPPEELPEFLEIRIVFHVVPLPYRSSSSGS